MKSMTSIFRRTLALGITALAASLFATPPVHSQPAPEAPPANVSLADTGACIADTGQLDVIVLLDETGSLVNEIRDGEVNPDAPGADSEHNRVPAAQSFIDQLLDKQEDEGFSTNVRIAGFGEEYKSGATDPDNYGDWEELSEATIGDLDDQIEAFTERTNEDYTNYANALAGAYQDFSQSGSEDPCRMLVTFTDGALTAAGGVDAAEQQLCAPGGVADQLRGAGVTNIGIGLSAPTNPSDFSLLQGITEGGTGGGQVCGESEPRGAFFTADNVGGLFASFREALATGGELSLDTNAAEPFTFTLDSSIDAVRFTAIARDDLGPDAHLVLTAPNGQTLDLVEAGDSELNDAAISWEASADPVQMADGEMDLNEGGDWAGVWSLQFENFDTAAADAQVFNSVEIQPDLQVQLSGGETQHEGALTLRDDEPLVVQLVDGEGQPRALEGEASLDLLFNSPATGGQTMLAEGLDFASGQAEISLDPITTLPALGTIEAQTSITTAGVDGQPGSALSPIRNTTALTVTQRDMPQLPGNLSFRAEEEIVQIDVPVTGPGRVWLPAGTELTAESLPEGVTSISATSSYDSAENALELGLDETGTLPVELTITELNDGLVNAVLPLNIANPEGANETTVDVPTEGTLATPVDTPIFIAALIGALLLALLIPLLLLYGIRYWAAKIPKESTGVITIPLELRNGVLDYRGQPRPELEPSTASQNQVVFRNRDFNAGLYPVKVKSFQLNPFAPAVAVVEQSPSISGEGRQDKGRAQLPLAVQGTWFITARRNDPTSLDLVVLPRIPLSQEHATQLSNDIQQKAPDLARELSDQLAATDADTDQPGSGAAGGFTTTPDKDQPAPPNFGSGGTQGGFGSGSGGFGSGGSGDSQGGFGSGGSQGGFGSGGGGFGSGGSQGGFGSGGGGFGSGDEPGSRN